MLRFRVGEYRDFLRGPKPRAKKEKVGEGGRRGSRTHQEIKEWKGHQGASAVCKGPPRVPDVKSRSRGGKGSERDQLRGNRLDFCLFFRDHIQTQILVIGPKLDRKTNSKNFQRQTNAMLRKLMLVCFPSLCLRLTIKWIISYKVNKVN